MDLSPLFLQLLKMVLDNMSPQLRQIIVDAVINWEKVAAQTASPWDDLLIKALKIVLEIK